MRQTAAVLFCLCLLACQSYHALQAPAPGANRISGSAFFKSVAAFNWQQRDSAAIKEILSGNFPSFLKKFHAVQLFRAAAKGEKDIHLVFYVMPDYLSVGTDEDWARVPLTPMAAQRIADSLHCFLPTKALVDAIYSAAALKLEPVPMFAYRDSSPTMYHHHLMIEGQRKERSGLIGGIKKDVVISGKVLRDARPNRVAIYGWHKLDGKPIQPLYTGHVNWYVDYSHGIRLIYRKVKVNGEWMDYTDVFKHPVYHDLLCNEEPCDFFRYSY